ncbi:hypothetical protein BD408DRAFT_447172 [Parasitella parasitica]|nr:hypothetical protein BD408DRAFT_447172 [Parasitella parasitica]
MSSNIFNTYNSTNQHKKCRYECAENLQCQLHSQNKSEHQVDVSQHLRSLKARLGFARFKLNQGWEKSTIFDVEQLWRQKQKRNIHNLPRPRFTQREIIDKRMYIPSPGARQARAKRDGLVRTLSNPTDWPECSSVPKKSQKQLYFHHYYQPKAIDNAEFEIPSSNQRYDSSIEEGSSATDDEKIPQVRNSLDYLSYAIAMTEKKGSNDNSSNSFMFSSLPLPDISELEPNLIDNDKEQVEDLSITNKISPPLSPTTSAANAIMMFVNNCNTSSGFDSAEDQRK